MEGGVLTVADEVAVWIEEGGSIHLKTLNGSDPAELTEEAARELAATLVRLAERL